MTSTVSTLALVGSLALAALAPAPASAHSASEAEGRAALRSTPFADETYGPGTVRGEAELEQDGDRLRVEAEIEGLTPGTTHVGHIHFGDCDGLFPGTIIHNLTPITVDDSGEGESRTVIGTTDANDLVGVEDCEWWVAFHEGPQNTQPQSPAVAIGPVLVDAD